MWHIFKAELSDRKYFFVLGNLLLGLAIFALYIFQDHPAIPKALKISKTIGMFAIASLTMGLTTSRSQLKRDRQQSLLPITTQRVGIVRLGASVCFWACLLFWIQTGIYLTQNMTSYSLFIIESGQLFALAITLTATIHIIHDQMYNVFTDRPSTGKNPLILLLVGLSYGALVLIFLESSFGTFGWGLTVFETTFPGSIFYFFLSLSLSIATPYISSLMFTKRHSYLI